MQTVLICGGTGEERVNLARQKVKDVCWEDLIFLAGKDSLGIEEIRQLEHRLNLKPYRSSYKATIVEDAQRLTVPAQNALLKTLEEPPKNTLLILTAPQPGNLLPTIVSRCQIIELAPKTEIKLSEEEIQNQLSAVSHQLSAGIGERLGLAGKVTGNRQDSLEFLNKQTPLWREILWQKLQISKASPLVDGRLTDLAIQQLVCVLRQLQKTKQLIERNINARLAMEIFFLDLPIV